MPASNNRILIFRIGNEKFAIEISVVEEVLSVAKLKVPPACPPLIKGFLQIGNRSIPVINIEKLLELPVVEISRYTPMIVLKKPFEMAFLADAVLEVTIIDEALGDLKLLEKESSFIQCCRRYYQSEGGIVYSVDPEQLFSSKEIKIIEAFKAKEIARLELLVSASDSLPQQ